MLIDQPQDRQNLTTHDRALAESFARELHSAKDARSLPRLEDFLARSRSPDRSYLFRELLRTDWRRMLAMSKRPNVVSYVARFPHFDGVVLRLAEIELKEEEAADKGSNPAGLGSDRPSGREQVVASTIDEMPAQGRPVKQTSDFVPTEAGKEEDLKAPNLPASLRRYNIKELLGHGQYGKVYRAYDGILDRDVAIKVTSKRRGSSDDELLAEARRLAHLRHPNIVTVLDAQVSEGSVYIVSDYVVGIDLRQWLVKHQPSWRISARIVATLADALNYAHAASTVHRDVKPANIILTGIDRNAEPDQLVPVLVDFGLALTEAETDGQQRGMVAGTPAYMSPEQIRGLAHRIDGRTDIYSLGIMLYEMLTGRLPFRAHDLEEIARQVCLDAPQPPRQLVPSVPPELESICLKAIGKDINQRFSTAGDCAEALRDVLAADATASSARRREDSKSGVSRSSSRPVPLTSSVLSENESIGHSSRFERVEGQNQLYEAGRRQLTALYCRVLNASELAELFDPEEERELLHDYQLACHTTASRYEGTIERLIGEDILIYFGYPTAQEDAGQRAVRMGLELIEAIDELNQRLRRVRNVEISIGVAAHTSEVVAEESGDLTQSSRIAIIGNAPKVAAALAEHADGKSVFVTSTTFKLLRDEFSFKPLGLKSLRGFRQPIESFAIEGEGDDSSSGTRKSQETAFVGRTAEWESLKQRWTSVLSGHGQVGMICGEAGIGKSRLVKFFKTSLGQEPRISIECRCSAYHVASALYPITNLFQKVLKLDQERSPENKLIRLESLLDEYHLPKDELVSILAPLLSIPLGRKFSPLTLTSEQRKRKTIDALLAIPLAMSEQQPVLFIIEDLHWSDPSTLDLLGQLIDRARLSRLMIVLTFRPDFQPPWPMRPHVFPVTLGVLDDEQAKQLVASICGEERLSAEILRHIIQRTDGVPIFIEELTRYLLDSEYVQRGEGQIQLIGPINSLAIPSTLQDSLMARLDRLGEAKEVAQLGATLGREFDYELLKAVSPLSEEALQRELARLVDADLLHQRGYAPRVRYLFKHVLVRDEAYHSLLRRTRELHHHTIAQTLERQFAHVAEDEPELLAHHYSEAKLYPQAIDYWWKAGSRARERSAYAEAICHLRRGLESITKLDNSADPYDIEFKFQFALGVSHVAARGYAAHEVGQIFHRARELAEQAQDDLNHFFVLRMTWAWHVVRAEFDMCRELADQVEKLSKHRRDPGLLLEGQFAQALTRFYRGDFVGSREHAEMGFSLYDQDRCQSIAEQTGQNSGVTIQCYLAWSLWCLGYVDQALARMNEAVGLARELGHPYSLAYAIAHLGRLQDYCRLGSEARQTGNELLECGREYTFPFWEAIGHLEIGRGLLHEGHTAEAIEETRFGLEIHQRTGAQLSLPYHHGSLADAHIQLGQTDRARTTLDEAWTAMRRSEETAHESELHRLEGELERARPQGDNEYAQSCFQQAIEVARRQHGKSYELRAALSRAKAYPPSDNNDPNYRTLSEIYNWFSEGLQLPDQTESKATLEHYS